jgi:phospholipid transport system substrate-binding protein
MRKPACTNLIVSGLVVLVIAAVGVPEAPAASPTTAPTASPAPADGTRPGPAAGETAATPEQIVQRKWAEVIAVLRDPHLEPMERQRRIEVIVGPIIDFNLMGKLALGRAHWTRMTWGQRAKYLPLFEERFKRSYREKIALYEGDDILMKFLPSKSSTGLEKSGPSRRGAKSAKTAHVTVDLLSNGKHAAVLHKFRKVGDQWKLYDVEIEGVSILMTYRSQFDDVLKTGTIEDLLARLEEAPPP